MLFVALQSSSPVDCLLFRCFEYVWTLLVNGIIHVEIPSSDVALAMVLSSWPEFQLGYFTIDFILRNCFTL